MAGKKDMNVFCQVDDILGANVRILKSSMEETSGPTRLGSDGFRLS